MLGNRLQYYLTISKKTFYNVPSLATIATTIDVVVEELCKRTVTRTPIIRSAIGLLSISLLWNASPAFLPIIDT